MGTIFRLVRIAAIAALLGAAGLLTPSPAHADWHGTADGTAVGGMAARIKAGTAVLAGMVAGAGAAEYSSDRR
jgi:hypothetical protein